MNTQALNVIFDDSTRALLTAIRSELEDFNNRVTRQLTAALDAETTRIAALETTGGHHVTAPTPILSTAGGLPQIEPSVLQDIDEHSIGYSAGLSGGVAS